MAEKKEIRDERPTEVETEEIFIQKSNPRETEIFVAVNGENKLLKTGMTHRLPKAFAEVIRNSLSAQAEADARIEEISVG